MVVNFCQVVPLDATEFAKLHREVHLHFLKAMYGYKERSIRKTDIKNGGIETGNGNGWTDLESEQHE